MRFVGLASLLVGALLLAGCGLESSRQTDARLAVERSLAASKYDRERTHCTDNPSPWFVERETEVFLCVTTRRDGGCDLYRATLRNAGWDVVLQERDSSCVLLF